MLTLGTGKDEGGPKLDTFSGENSADYRKWRRRATLYLQALPTTIPEKKWGARLIEHLSGEAEELMDSLEVDEIVQQDGWKTIFKMLDDKYKEPEKMNSREPLRSTCTPLPSRKENHTGIS